MSIFNMIAKSKAASNNDGDFFLPNLRGTITIERLFQHNGDKGTSVVLTGIIETCEAKIEGATAHKKGAKVKKIYALSKYPEVAPGQLKGDVLAITDTDEDEFSVKQLEDLFAEVFTNDKSEMFELRGVRCSFDTRVIDRSAKGKENLVGVKFKALPEQNKPEDVAARRAAKV